MTTTMRRYLAIVVLTGMASAATAALVAAPTDVNVVFVVLVGVAMLAATVPIRFARAGQTQGFTLEGGAFAAMLLSGFGPIAPVTMVAISLVAHGVRTRDLVKTVFNAGRSGLETAAAATVFLVLAPPDLAPTSVRAVVATLVAMVAFELVSVTTMTELFHRLSGRARGAVARDASRLSLITWAGNVASGIVLAAVAVTDVWVAVLAGSLMPVIYLGYRGYAAAVSGQRRADALNEMTHLLLELPSLEDGLPEVLAGLLDVFGGSQARMVVEVAGGYLHLTATETGVQREELTALPRAGLLATAIARDRGILDADGTTDPPRDAVAAPIRRHGRARGAVAVLGRRGLEPWDLADVSLLAAVGNELAVALDNLALLGQVDEERARLEAESRKLGDILDAASDGIASVSADGTIGAWNPGMARITGVSSEQALGQPWHGVLRMKGEDGVELAPSADHAVTRALRGQLGDGARSLQVLRSDGAWRRLAMTVSGVFEHDGSPRGVVLVARDVTAERELEDLKADFISTVSHELRTPLTPLRGFLSTLANPSSSLTPDQVDTVYTSMGSQLMRLETLISDLLAVAELDHGQFALRPEAVAIGPVVTDAVLVEAADQHDRCTVSVETRTAALADPVALVRVVRSLVTNALKHTGGSVRVRVFERDEEIGVAVADQGPGIPAWDQERIWGRFERLGDHLRRPQGPGLGLTIARALASRMGGRIDLSSEIGEGSTFTLWLPRAAPRLVPVEPDAPADRPAARG